jgi:pimeloyl-ACP methyl ester carboxylesterase
VVLPARAQPPAPDPLFFAAGGPGQGAAGSAAAFWNGWQRERRDVVLVDQRGTGQSQPLQCQLPGSDSNLQGYFESIYQRSVFERCRQTLAQRADLTQCTTMAAVHDLDEVRRALGYERINLLGVSGGTRTSLLYARAYPLAVRALILYGLAPPTLRNPLPHARSSQDAIAALFDACAAEAACQRAFPNVASELRTVLERLDRAPAPITVPDPRTGRLVQLNMPRDFFANALRVLLYNSNSARLAPLLIHRAFTGDYQPLVERGLPAVRAQRDGIAMGVLMSSVCSEDAPAITEADIVEQTRGTFLGDARVREQLAACSVWPRANLPASHSTTVVSAVPALLISGRYDPVTPPRWGEETLRGLRNGVHLVIPRGHSMGTPCTSEIARQFLNAGTMSGIDTSCVSRERLPPFALTL